MSGKDLLNNLFEKIYSEVMKIIGDFKLDVDDGIEIYLYSNDLTLNDLKYILNMLRKRLKIVYSVFGREDGFYSKKINIGNISLEVGVRPTIV